MQNKTRAFIKNATAAGALLLVLWKLVYGNQIYATADTVSNVTTGQVVQIRVHGRDLYITADQKARLDPFHWTSGLFVFLLVVTVAVRRP